MRGLALAVAALMVSAVPAHAAWQYYSGASDNFASQFPDAPKMETGRLSMPRHGLALSARNYTATVDNIVYRVTVADYSDRAADGASIMEEAIFQYTEADDHGARNGKIVGNETTRIEPVGRGATYGRRIAMDLPNNGGRNVTAFYFRDGKLYEQSVVILPANGDYNSPYASRFVDSLVFNLSRLPEEAGGPVPNIQGCGTQVTPFTFKPAR